MPSMKKTALSDCSYPESTVYNIRDDIDATITRLKVVIDEEASLRKALRALFVKRREAAIDQVRLANVHLDLVNEEEAAFCDDLMKAAASANEGLEGSGCAGNVSTKGVAMPTLFPIPTPSRGNGPGLNKVEDAHRKIPMSPKMLNRGRGYGATTPPRIPASPTRNFNMELHRSPAQSTRGLFYPPQRSPARSARAFDPRRSPARSTHAFVDEPPRSPARSTRGLCDGLTRSPARSTRGLFDEPPRSPARFTHAFEPPRSPARSTDGLDPTSCPARSGHGLDDGPMAVSPARSNRGLSSDAPPRSPARSTRGLEDTYLSPDGAGHSQRTPGKTQSSLPPFSFGDNYGSGIEVPKKSPARPSAALPTTFAFGGGGFGTSPTTNAGFGFGTSPTLNTTFGFGASPATNTGFAFGAGSQPPSASIGFGPASLKNTGFGFGGTSPTINFGLRPGHPTFDAITDPMQTP